ncbi:methyltransferase, FxLD system [Actinokineospora cianjurensis]|uniref:Protein-L-isoaspartate O-methyltransferase n=1 Tax=Actinokineospora cianjurensis TaxID=585224 RepID=A0A421AXC1_9PSEU|nr:methyltransferase, FxLD system [Actinokineospora cianjurensis]RLK54454.1 protein-L-isoaspartate(D-aspartate) O-methyltransferase [Actinokineospora cianjurensis]
MFALFASIVVAACLAGFGGRLARDVLRQRRSRAAAIRLALRYSPAPVVMGRHDGHSDEAVSVADLLIRAAEQGRALRLNWSVNDTDPHGLATPTADDWPTGVLPRIEDDMPDPRTTGPSLSCPVASRAASRIRCGRCRSRPTPTCWTASCEACGGWSDQLGCRGAPAHCETATADPGAEGGVWSMLLPPLGCAAQLSVRARPSPPTRARPQTGGNRLEENWKSDRVNTLRDDSSVADATSTPDELRAAMVAEMRRQGDFSSSEVEAAFARVPRHLFAPNETAEAAYRRNDIVERKYDADGLVTSSVSAPWLQATMLEQAELRPGMRVLEIGSGGYNAALIAELVGETGQVTTLDIDAEIVERSRRCLDAAGYPHVAVILGDGEHAAPGRAPFDRIIVTAGAWDIPPAWIDQLAQDGRIVVPLRVRGLERSFVLARDGEHLVSTGHRLCGFVSMQGEGANRERLTLLRGEEVALRIDGENPADPEGLRAALDMPRVEVWSGVEVGGFEPFHEMDLWLASQAEHFALLVAQQSARDSGLVSPGTRMGAKTVIDGATFAYRAHRPTSPDRSSFEFGVYAHGPDAQRLAEDYAELIRAWDRDHRHGPGAHIDVWPAGTPDADLPHGRVIDKQHTRVSISWPQDSAS